MMPSPMRSFEADADAATIVRHPSLPSAVRWRDGMGAFILALAVAALLLASSGCALGPVLWRSESPAEDEDFIPSGEGTLPLTVGVRAETRINGERATGKPDGKFEDEVRAIVEDAFYDGGLFRPRFPRDWKPAREQPYFLSVDMTVNVECSKFFMNLSSCTFGIIPNWVSFDVEAVGRLYDPANKILTTRRARARLQQINHILLLPITFLNRPFVARRYKRDLARSLAVQIARDETAKKKLGE